MSQKSTPRDILLVYDDKSDRVAKLVMNSLPATRFPVSRRNIRWGFKPEHYFLVFLIGQKSLKAYRANGNCQFYPYEGYGAYLHDQKKKGTRLKRLSMRRYQEQEAREIAEKISAIFQRFA